MDARVVCLFCWGQGATFIALCRGVKISSGRLHSTAKFNTSRKEDEEVHGIWDEQTKSVQKPSLKKTISIIQTINREDHPIDREIRLRLLLSSESESSSENVFCILVVRRTLFAQPSTKDQFVSLYCPSLTRISPRIDDLLIRIPCGGQEQTK